jgi:glycosyltransferase involved in cell wall biosynthesis
VANRSIQDRPLRIVQVSAADMRGGAEQVALQLHRSYRRLGHQAWLLVGEQIGEAEPGVIRIDNESARDPWARWWRALGRGVGAIPNAGRLRSPCELIAEPRRQLRLRNGHEDFDHPASRRLFDHVPSQPDLVHLHNLHSTHPYFDLRILAAVSRSMPTFLTLHDAWLTTGHCAHSFACDRWQSGCGQCPDLTIYPAIRRDATAANWLAKRHIFAASRVYVTTPSHWLMRRVEKSILWPAVIGSQVIPNGVDTEIFEPGSKAESRATLQLPVDQPVVLAMTGGAGNQFKDRKTLLAAIDRLATLMRGPWTMVLLGESDGRETRGNLTVRSVASIGQSAVATHLSAADVLIHAAHVDTFPNSILEAMACGTPVVATAVGGIPEQICSDDQPTGMLTLPGDADAVAQAAWRILSDPSLRQHMAENAVAHVREHFTLAAQIQATEQFYRQAITS